MDRDCDDGAFCTGAERCDDGRCAPPLREACDDGVSCTEDVCLEEIDRCFHEPVHERCADDDLCDGIELCDPAIGCREGAPLRCADSDACTIDRCVPATGCAFLPRDLDNDGFVDRLCGGADCNDSPGSGAMISPDAVEICGDGIDSDCDDKEDVADRDCPTGNNRCDRRIQLPTDGTRGTFNAFGLEDNYQPICRFADGLVDAYFGISIDESQDVTFRAQSLALGAFTVEARPASTCESGVGSPRGCIVGGGEEPSELFLRSLPVGEHAFILEMPGLYWVEVELAPPTPIPKVDVCADDTAPLPTERITGFFSDVGDDIDLSCTSSPGWFPDAVYRLSLDERSDVLIQASGPPRENVRIAFTDDCALIDAEIACIEGGPTQILRPELPAGEYFVIVEPTNPGSPHTYDISASVAPVTDRAAGDSCGTAFPVIPNTPGVTFDVTDTFRLDAGASCRSDVGDVDAVVRFTIPTRQQVGFFVDAGGEPNAIAIRRGDCGLLRDGGELACNAATGTQTFATILGAGAYSAIIQLPAPPDPDTPIPLRVIVATSDPP